MPSASHTTNSKVRALTPAVPHVPLQSTNAQACIKSVTSHIESLTFSSSSLSSRLRFDSISRDDFAAVLESPAYKSLYKTYSGARTHYNSFTQVLILQCMANLIHDPYSFVACTIFANPHIQLLPNIFTISSNSDFFHFNGPYEGSQKQADAFVRIHGSYWPTLVVETGWSEDHRDLVEDAKLWLLGSRGGSPGKADRLRQPVNVVIIIFFDHENFEADQSSLKGYFEVWRCDAANANAITRCLSTVSDLASPTLEPLDLVTSRLKQFYPTPPIDSTIVEFTLEEIVRTTNVPPGVSGTTAIQFDLRCLAEQVEGNIERHLMHFPEKRRIKAAKRQEVDNATRMSEQPKQEQEDGNKRAEKRVASASVVKLMD